MMKKHLVWLLSAATVLFACSQEKDFETASAEASGQGGVNAESEITPPIHTGETIWDGDLLVAFSPLIEGIDTKLSIGADGTTSFAGGEAVLVTVTGSDAGVQYVYDIESNVFKVASGETPVRVKEGDTASIYYPYDCFALPGGVATYTLPSFDGALGNLGSKNPMAAQAKLGDQTITLLNLATLIRVDLLGNAEDITAGVTLSTLTLSSSNAPLAAGSAWGVDWTGERPVFASNAGAASAQSFTVNQALDADTATSFYFIVPYSAGGTLAGLTVTAKNSDNKEYARTRTSALSLSPKTIIHMGFRAGLFRAGDGLAEATAFEIATADDFRQMAKLINEVPASYKGAFYKQVADIDFREGYGTSMADLSAYMIGDASSTDTRFSGAYDGGNYTLSYFSLTGTENNTGLWRASSNATFKNIKVDNASLSGTGYVGTIVANMSGNSSKMSACTVTNTTVTATGNTVGGVIGRAYGTVSGCRFGVGDTNSSVSGAQNVGGIIGNCFATNITSCVNAAPVSGTDVYVGGVIGLITDVTATVASCVNSGSVKAYTGSAYKNYAGGIIGSYYMSNANNNDRILTIDGATNSGPVEGNSGVGGIIGGTSTSTQATAHEIIIKGVVTNDITSGNKAVTGHNTNIGGIIGFPTMTKLTIEGTSQNTTAVSGVSNTGGIVGQLTVTESTVTGAANYGAVTISTTAGGGIVGNVNVTGCSVSSCTNNGKIVSNIASDANSKNTYLGGIVGVVNNNAYSCDITGCTNLGEVSSSYGIFLGGIIGDAKLGTIDKCLNKATVSGGNSNVGGIAGSARGTLVKRCYNSKSAKVQGTHRVGGIVGVITTAPAKIVNCANYGLILGTGNGAYAAGGILGMVNSGLNAESLVANCLVRDRDQMVISTNSSAASKYLLGGIVGDVESAATFQSIFVPLLAVGIQTYSRHAGNNTTNTVTLYSGQTGKGATAANTKTMSVTTGKTLGATAVFKDCYVRGSATYGINWNPNGDGMTKTYVKYFSNGGSNDWAIAGNVEYTVAMSDGTTTFTKNTTLANVILTKASTLISSSDYTPATDETMEWSDVAIGTKTHYAIPAALMEAFPGVVNEE